METSYVYTPIFLDSFKIIEKIINQDELVILCKANFLTLIGIDPQHTQILLQIIDNSVVISLNLRDSPAKQKLKRHHGTSGRNRVNMGGWRKIEKGCGIFLILIYKNFR